MQGNPYTEEGRRANFALLDTQSKGELDINDMRYINDQLKYGYTDDYLQELIKTVGGFGADSITVDRYNKLIDKKVKNRRAGVWLIYAFSYKYIFIFINIFHN